MRKVVANAEVAARAGELKAVYEGGERVKRLPEPVKPLNPAEAFAKLEAALRALPQIDIAPVMAALEASRDAVLAAIAAANRPRKFTMHHVRNGKGRIVDTIVTEE